MKYVLDTNTVSALMKGDANAVARLISTDRADVGIPQPVIAEIEYGITRLSASKSKARLSERWKLFADELKRLPWTDDVSEAFGTIKAALERRGRLIEDFDIAIAAHAVAIEATLVTANTAHMSRITGIRLQDWTTK